MQHFYRYNMKQNGFDMLGAVVPQNINITIQYNTVFRDKEESNNTIKTISELRSMSKPMPLISFTITIPQQYITTQ